MNALRLADGTMYPLFSEDPGDVSRLTLYPASPGAHPVQINLYQGPDLEQLSPQGTLRMEGSGSDLSLVLTRNNEEGVEVVLTDLGNGTIATDSFPGGSSRSTFQEESLEETGGWEEQLALVDNFEDPVDERGLSIPEDPDVFDMSSDLSFDEELEDPPSEGAAFFGYQPSEVDTDSDFEDENLFGDEIDDEDDDEENTVDSDDELQELTRRSPHPLVVAGVSFFTLGICFAAAYGVFMILKGDSHVLLEQLLP